MLVILSVAPDGRLVFKSRYDPDLVEVLKAMIPSCDRTWDTAAKTWYLAPDWSDGLVETLRDLGMTVTDTRPPPPQTTAVALAVAPALHQACLALHITPDEPVAVAEASFKALAKRHHPDVGGDTATFQELNKALATFKVFNEVP